MEGFFHLLYVAVLSNNNIDTVNQVAATVMVDNETVEWDCQEYVLDMLDALEEEFVLDRDDENYQWAREFLMEREPYSVAFIFDSSQILQRGGNND